ncbi:hypothetical protein GCM10009839_43650 [Catenulispora yoronensis]|uniref:Uncharacterized protein n=1 Tax=Catenulispora yoronensis TaxID=450799 RepID=A0ABN2UJR8_9ACTN
MLAAAWLLPLPTAHAASSTTCTGTSQLTYSPGLKLTPRNVTFTENDTIGTCTSTDTTLTSADTLTYSYPIAGATCDDISAATNTGELVMHWNNGQTSTLNGLVGEETITDGILQDTATGTVIAGEFNGAAAVINWTYIVNPLACLSTGGLTTLNGTVLVQISGA